MPKVGRGLQSPLGGDSALFRSLSRWLLGATKPPATNKKLQGSFCPYTHQNRGLLGPFQAFYTLHLPYRWCFGARPDGTPDFRSLFCLPSKSQSIWEPGSTGPPKAAKTGGTACSPHGLERRRSCETPQQVLEVSLKPAKRLRGGSSLPSQIFPARFPHPSTTRRTQWGEHGEGGEVPPPPGGPQKMEMISKTSSSSPCSLTPSWAHSPPGTLIPPQVHPRGKGLPAEPFQRQT